MLKCVKVGKDTASGRDGRKKLSAFSGQFVSVCAPAPGHKRQILYGNDRKKSKSRLPAE